MTSPLHAVGVILEDRSGKLLVLRRHVSKPEGGTWGLPGGKVEAGETPLDAAVREAREETGHVIDPAALRFVRTYRGHWGGRDVMFDVFTLPVRSENIDVALEEDAHTEHLWVTPRELSAYTDLMEGFHLVLKDLLH